jgi:hypothetical protein
MLIPVVLKDGHEDLVSKEELQFLLLTQKIMLFKRSDGWAVLERNRMRNQRVLYNREDRRQHNFYSLN